MKMLRLMMVALMGVLVLGLVGCNEPKQAAEPAAPVTEAPAAVEPAAPAEAAPEAPAPEAAKPKDHPAH